MGSEQLKTQTADRIDQNGKTPQQWEAQYREQLRNRGWSFITAQEGGIRSSLVAAHDENTIPLVKEWAETKEPVEVSIVVVPPNSEVHDLPARTLGYVSSALMLSTYIRERNGVNVDSLRIVSPSHINVYSNGGDLKQQLTNAQQFSRLIRSYKEGYYPNLDSVSITLDTGHPVSPAVEAELIPKVTRIQSTHPEVARLLYTVSRHYSLNGKVPRGMDESQRPIAYLLAHPEAWGYSEEETLFAQNGYRRINFVPASELRYLHLMTEVQGVWKKATDKQIATVVSAKQTRAPYYSMQAVAEGLNEPTIGDLSAPGGLQEHSNRLKKLSGRIEIAEVLANLNQIKSDVEQANFRRKVQKMGVAPSLAQIVSQV